MALLKECYSIDESGFTGPNLLDSTQPFMGACAICIGDEKAQDLIQKYFPDIKSRELKFGTISKRHEPLLEMLKYLLINHKCVTYVKNKEYMLILKLINSVECHWHDRGVNIYENGLNFKLACSIYYNGREFFGKENYTNLLNNYQNCIKHKNSESRSALVSLTTSISTSIKCSNKDLINDIVAIKSRIIEPLALNCPFCFNEINSPNSTTDVMMEQGDFTSYRH